MNNSPTYESQSYYHGIASISQLSLGATVNSIALEPLLVDGIIEVYLPGNDFLVDETDIKNLKKKNIVEKNRVPSKTVTDNKTILENLKESSDFMANYEKQYIVMKNGQIVDSDNDFSKLVERVIRKFGDLEDLLITQVEQGTRTAEFLTPF